MYKMKQTSLWFTLTQIFIINIRRVKFASSIYFAIVLKLFYLKKHFFEFSKKKKYYYYYIFG